MSDLMWAELTTVEDWVDAGHPVSWNCADCSIDTAPGCPNAVDLIEAGVRHADDLVLVFNENTELFQLRQAVWLAAVKDDLRIVLCIGCVEKRLGRKLRPKDFDRKSPFRLVPGTARLNSRRGRKNENAKAALA